ncbi:serine/threonine-protein phosphatase, partial [Streptomyces sp. NPDC059082]
MSVPLPHNVDDLKTMIGREVTSLRAVVRRTAERPVPAPPGTDVTPPVHARGEVPVAESTAPRRCGTHGR